MPSEEKRPIEYLNAQPNSVIRNSANARPNGDDDDLLDAYSRAVTRVV